MSRLDDMTTAQLKTLAKKLELKVPTTVSHVELKELVLVGIDNRGLRRSILGSQTVGR